MPTDDTPLQDAAATVDEIVDQATDAVDRRIDELTDVPVDDGEIEEFALE